MSNDTIKIGITTGDLNGIGIEVIIKTFSDVRMLQNCTPVIYGSSKTISFHRKTINIPDFNYNTVRNADAVIHRKVNLLNCWDEEVKMELGPASETSAKYALKSLDAAVSDLSRNKIHALVTAPVNKAAVQRAGFNFPGHTEYFADKFNLDKTKQSLQNFLMLMVSENLKIGVVTGHIPLQSVASQLSVEMIFQKIQIMNKSLMQDFGIVKPKIAVLGLNPHAGEDGQLGNEEKTIILPAVQKAYQEKIMVYGPYPADGFFGASLFTKYDGILAMYHDQGLIPFKAISFTSGVNFTAGLSVVRTSPDHGTGADIAGKNQASEASFREAVFLAQDIYKKRQEYASLTANPLPFTNTASAEHD